MCKVIKRLSEPSTYAGLAALAVAFGVTDAEWATISTAAAGVFAVAAMLLGESGDE